MARRDPHSYADDTQVETAAFAWTARVDFASRTLAADVTLTFRAPGGGRLDLDTRDLAITSVVDATGAALAFTLHPPEPYLGARLAIELPPATTAITIAYRTSPDASALQWLAPAQTRGGKHPYLFSQCQAIHARSILPLQDTPRLRVRYTAALTVPQALKVVMAAAHRGRDEAGELATERWEMPQPIPPYLLAFAVGDLASRDLSPRSRVWAEPAMVDAAAHEFADVEAMIGAAEQLFGPYDWERFDILTMPPSFPYGGMENPRLTFLTPTVIAGDRSLVSVVAHELAHSWTGNLVTNANAEHFWLNEGFTMYAERRITEALEGADMASLSAALGRRELDESIHRFADRPEMTKLRTHLTGVDPDECYSLIPYEKGYFFLCAIEAHVGREAFSRWLRSYLAAFRFGAITTEDFAAHIEAALPGALAAVDAPRWLDEPGIPASAAAPRSARLTAIEALAGAVPTRDVAARWTATEWTLFLESVPRPAPAAACRALGEDHRLTASTNFDVLVAWLTLALQSGYHAVLPRVDWVLATVGRMKYLRPLYTALAADPRTRGRAEEAFARHRASYHPIARSMVEGVLRAAGPRYTLYGAPGTASMLPHWLLLEIGAPHELVMVDVDAGAHKRPEYLALNPNGVVPAMLVDGAPHYESAALALLLAERHPEARLEPARGTPARAEYLQWMFHLANTLQPAFRAWFYPAEAAGPANADAAKAAARARIEAAWDRVAARLADRPYLVGEQLTAADFYATMLMRWSRNMPKPATAWPALAAYVARMKARPSFAELYRREGLTEWA